MREIPSAVQTLLKSRSMIGENKPTCEVVIEGIANEKVASGIKTKVFKLGTEPIDWKSVDFDDSAWVNAAIYSNVYWMSIPNAKPIWHPVMNLMETCLFRHTFYLLELPTNVNISFNHDNDLLGLYINGNFIISQVNDNQYPWWEHIYTIDITQYLQIGKNVISAKVNDNGTMCMFQFALDLDIESRIKPKSINISRNKNMSGSLNISIDNKNGEWSPDNTFNQNVLFPNKEVTVNQGYGNNLIQTFNGLIDRIEMTTFPQELKLSVRDKLKLALDQTITSGTSHVITYTAQTVETIFSDLASKAGLTTGTIETTGITLAEKTFSWETYADCFQWLADLVGFEYGADEEGLIYFRKESIPDEPIVAYEFTEGMDIISLGYTIDDNDIYSKIIVYGKDENDNVISASKDYISKDYYNVLSQKVMKIDASDADTVEKSQAIAERAEMLMRSRVRIVNFAAVAVPWLQIGDIVRVTESSTTISELYRITDLSTSYDKSGYTMQITCYHHSA